jgi:hypothetical protein
MSADTLDSADVLCLSGGGDAVGVIIRVAGTIRTPGSAGDDGPATDAQLNYAGGGGGDRGRRVLDR